MSTIRARLRASSRIDPSGVCDESKPIARRDAERLSKRARHCDLAFAGHRGFAKVMFGVRLSCGHGALHALSLLPQGKESYQEMQDEGLAELTRAARRAAGALSPPFPQDHVDEDLPGRAVSRMALAARRPSSAAKTRTRIFVSTPILQRPTGDRTVVAARLPSVSGARSSRPSRPPFLFDHRFGNRVLDILLRERPAKRGKFQLVEPLKNTPLPPWLDANRFPSRRIEGDLVARFETPGLAMLRGYGDLPPAGERREKSYRPCLASLQNWLSLL